MNSKINQSIGQMLWGLCLLAWIFLLPSKAAADFLASDWSHNTASHLVESIGLDLCKYYAGFTGASLVGLTASACEAAAAASSAAIQEVEEAVEECVGDVGDCAGDIAGGLSEAGSEFAEGVASTVDELLVQAQLQGRITDAAGNAIALVPIQISPADDMSQATAQCQAVVRAFQFIPTVTSGDGSFTAGVPACGIITYNITPLSPLFTWAPGTRQVTVGVSSAGVSIPMVPVIETVPVIEEESGAGSSETPPVITTFPMIEEEAGDSSGETLPVFTDPVIIQEPKAGSTERTPGGRLPGETTR